MREILNDLDRWRKAGKRVALARVVDVEGSGPRLPGAAMAVNEDGEVAGSVSGGCVEGAVVTEALADHRVRRPAHRHLRLQRRRGLRRRPHVRRHDPPLHRAARLVSSLYDVLRDAIAAEEPVALATVVEGPGLGGKLLVRPDDEPMGTLGDADLDRVVARDTLGELAAGTTGVRHYGPHGEASETDVAVFIESFAAPPQLLIFGAVDFTAALARVARCSATGSPCATPGRSSPPRPGSRSPTRSSSTGPTACSSGSATSSVRGTPSAC